MERQIAVLKDEDAFCGVHGTTSLLPLSFFFFFFLKCYVFQDVCPSFSCMTGQLQNCAVCQALREDRRETVGDHEV